MPTAVAAAPKAPVATKRFAIRSTRIPEVKEGNKIIFGTGDAPHFAHTCELFASIMDENERGQPIIEFRTGLESKHIKYSKFIAEDEKEGLLKQQADAMKILSDAYGKDKLKPTNRHFWDKESSFIIDNETLVSFFDTKEPSHLLLYWKIKGGGYADEIGTSHDIARDFGLPFYMTEIAEEAERRTQDMSDKVKAYALLNEIDERRSQEDLLWLSWMLHPSNQGFTRSTPRRTLFAAHVDFIEGRLVKKAKKACAKQFIEAYDTLKNDNTRAIASALVKAGDYFQVIYTNKEGKMVTRKNGLVLGVSEEDAIDTLLKPINQTELELLREAVDEMLK